MMISTGSSLRGKLMIRGVSSRSGFKGTMVACPVCVPSGRARAALPPAWPSSP
uniref:Uncharacterized protein n=1 Tax=Arundo donax TaxID=35708 RepID=A0A0A9AY17_ARUDO